MKMRFKATILAVTVAMFGLTSCEKNNEEKGAGSLEIAFDFGPETRAIASTSKPTTSWAQNIKSLTLFLTNASGVVQSVHQITPLPTATGVATETRTFNNIAVGSYSAYLVANYDQTATVDAAAWAGAPLATVGQNISTLLMKLVALPGADWVDKDATAEASTLAFRPAGEIFLAAQTGVSVVADVTTVHATPFVLTRAVSMFRVRINPETIPNKTVDFDHTNANLRIRKVKTSTTMNSVYAPATVVGTNMIYSRGYSKVAPTTPYSPTTLASILDATVGQTHWKDVMVYPGGHATLSSSMFDIVIAGMAPVGYVPSDTNVAITGSARLVYWTAVVNKVIAANGILEVNVTLNSNGTTVITPPGQYGNITINAELAPWGNVTQVDVAI